MIGDREHVNARRGGGRDKIARGVGAVGRSAVGVQVDDHRLEIMPDHAVISVAAGCAPGRLRQECTNR